VLRSQSDDANKDCRPTHRLPVRRILLPVIALALAGLLLGGCDAPAVALPGLPLSPSENGLRLELPTPTPDPALALANDPRAEAPVSLIRLGGAAANRRAEISGLAWFDEMLILLPQYPDFAGDGSNVLFALPRAQIEAYLDGADDVPLRPMTLAMDDAAVRDAVPGFGGYEAIAFRGEQVWLTIEAWAAVGSAGYLVQGRVDRDSATVRLDPATLLSIPVQSAKVNVSDEAIVLAGDSLFTLYELNGAAINPAPVAHRFSLEGWALEPLPFPSIEYRITDATPVDENGRFWAINFFYPFEGLEVVEPEPLAAQYGEGPTHARQVHVERLLEFAWDGTQISRVERPPVQLRLALLGRNWEGIARLPGRGLLIVTDKYPTTVLGFVPLP
jgi:hypothetical protein